MRFLLFSTLVGDTVIRTNARIVPWERADTGFEKGYWTTTAVLMEKVSQSTRCLVL